MKARFVKSKLSVGLALELVAENNSDELLLSEMFGASADITEIDFAVDSNEENNVSGVLIYNVR